MEETVYSRKELIGSAAALGVKAEVVAGALKQAGLEQGTRAQVEAAIAAFLKQEV